MADCSPFFLPGQDHTCHADAAVIGCRLVSIKPAVNEVDSMPRIQHTGAAARAYGVAARDKAVGEKVMVFRSGVVPIETAGVIAHGAGVEAAADGKIVTLAAGVRVGTCLADAANGAQAKIALELGA